MDTETPNDHSSALHSVIARALLAITLTVLGTLTPILIKAARALEETAYAPENVICCAEAVKALVCAAATTHLAVKSTQSRPVGRVPFYTAAKLCALAVVFALHNNKLIRTVRTVDIATFQVWFTWRVPATALALRLFMKRKFTSKQKSALGLLVLGTMLTQWNGRRAQLTVSPQGLVMIFLLVGTK